MTGDGLSMAEDKCLESNSFQQPEQYSLTRIHDVGTQSLSCKVQRGKNPFLGEARMGLFRGRMTDD